MAHDAAVATALEREPAPQSGNRWCGCKEACAADAAPIYRGGSGCRSGMDGDDDGIACESCKG